VTGRYPKFVWRPKIIVPDTNLRAGIEVGTEILLAVNEEGEIVRKTVVFSLPNALFGEASIDGLSSAKFERQDKAKCI